MNSMNFGSLTTPMGMGRSMGMGMRMPRMKPRGLGGLGMMRMASGGLASGGHPSMGWLAVRDTLRSMPNHTVPDYMLARMASGGEVDYGIRGRADPLDYPRRALSRQSEDLDRARYELDQRPVSPPPRGGEVPRWIGEGPDPAFSHRARIDQTLADLDRGKIDEEEGYSFDPSDIPMSLSGARGLAGLLLPGPVMGGLSALVHSGDAGAPEMRKPERNGFDMRVMEAMGDPKNRYSSTGRMLRRLLGATR